MKGLLVGAMVALAASPAVAADMPASYGHRGHGYVVGGTVWRVGPPPELDEEPTYIRVVPVYRQTEIRSRSVYAERLPRPR
ncbi:hypothetical protein [Hansschlegelia sp. KR7-227]|uniref:hypothetical protein n=1 Tax=Hansschlegelia sp. KR7-227 TaxID=3400914 RepID=UPI003C124D02